MKCCRSVAGVTLWFAEVLYTTLIKGFARAGQVDQAVQIYEEMRKDAALAKLQPVVGCPSEGASSFINFFIFLIQIWHFFVEFRRDLCSQMSSHSRSWSRQTATLAGTLKPCVRLSLMMSRHKRKIAEVSDLHWFLLQTTFSAGVSFTTHGPKRQAWRSLEDAACHERGWAQAWRGAKPWAKHVQKQTWIHVGLDLKMLG